MKKLLIANLFILSVATATFSANGTWEACTIPAYSPWLDVAMSKNAIFLRIPPDGFYRSIDNGNRWTQMQTGLVGLPLCFTTRGDALFMASYGDFGISRSTDNGDHWTRVDAGVVASRTVNSLVATATDLYAATSGDSLRSFGLFSSSDNGSSWKEVAFTDQNKSLRFIAGSTSALFASFNGNGLYALSRDAKTWERCGGLPSTATVMTFAENGRDLFLGTDNITNGGVFHSIDNGKSWTGCNAEFGANPFVYSLAVNNEYLVASVSEKLYCSTDNGLTWKMLAAPWPSDNFAYKVFFSGAYLYAETNFYTLWRMPLSSVATQVQSGNGAQLHSFQVNRSRSSLRVSFNLPSPENVRITAYSLSGREIVSLTKGVFGAGVHSCDVSAKTFPAGSVVLAFQAGDRKFTKCVTTF
jgi:photosystem II stability/assembly factor-like uncharacterized protein